MEFISQANPVDYREKECLEVNNIDKNQISQNSQNEDEQVEKQSTPMGNENEDNNNVLLDSNCSLKNINSLSHNHFDPATNITGQPENIMKMENALEKPESALALNYRESISSNNNKALNSGRSRLPWIKDEPVEEQLKPMCDMVSIKHLPKVSYITITDDSDDSANTTDDSIAEELSFQAINYRNRHDNETNNSNESFKSNTDSASTNNSPVSEGSIEKVASINDSIDDLIENRLSSPKNEREVIIV